jgi:hypothetical protein
MTRTLTPEQKHARQMKALERKHAREDAKLRRDLERRRLARDLGKAIREMARRYASSSHRANVAGSRPNDMYAGKTEQHWDRAAMRQHRAMCRLTDALEDLATKGA